MENPFTERIKKQAEAIEKLQKQISDLISRILRFTNFYFVFQGMIFSYFMSSSPQISCKVKWIPCTLSLLVSIFNFLAVWENINTSLKLYEEEVNKWTEMDSLREMELQHSINAPTREQPIDRSPQPSKRSWVPHSWKMPLRMAVSYSTLLLLFCVYGCNVIWLLPN
ncbi:hypothetical protein NL676_013460 [Syzygium grande]|nr:hypothetical protein NL676_013460 [Syzygium grande]